MAPASDLSGAGASIGPLHRSEGIPVTEHQWAELPDVPVLAIERPPATAVYLACLGAFGARPDVVASGINPGANTGHLILHSGTVGAALTAAGLGVPALAVSVKWSETGYHWETAAQLAVPALDWVAAGDGAPRVLNLNVPNLPIAEVLGVREADLAPYGEFWVASSDIDSGDLRIEFQGPRHRARRGDRRRARRRRLRHGHTARRNRRSTAQGCGRIGRERARGCVARPAALTAANPYTSTVPPVDPGDHLYDR